MFAIRIKVEMETIGINLNIICCNADYMRALNRYNDQLCGEKPAYPCASLLETAGSQYAGSDRWMSAVAAANQYAIH